MLFLLYPFHFCTVNVKAKDQSCKAFWLNNSGLFVGACATAPHLLNPGEVHDGPPRRTHSIGDLIQRKEQCTSQIVPVDIISDLSFERRFSAINSLASGFN